MNAYKRRAAWWSQKNHPTSSTKSAALLYEEDWRITNENSRMSKDELMVDAKKSRKSNLPRCLPLYHQEIEVVRTHNAYQIGTSTTSMSSTNRGGHAQSTVEMNVLCLPRFITYSKSLKMF